MVFKTSLDKTAKVITILITLSFACIIAAQFVIVYYSGLLLSTILFQLFYCSYMSGICISSYRL